MPPKLKILHLEDIATDAELVYRELKRSNIVFDTRLVDNRHDYTLALKDYAPDIILSDHSLPSFNSIEALSILKQSNLNIPFILITATVSEDFAVDVMKAGATDYILKDRLQRLPNAVKNAIEKFRSEEESRRANQELNMLFNTIDEMYFSQDIVTARIVQISPACKKIFGYTATEFLTNEDLKLNVVYPEDMPIIKANYHDYHLGKTVTCQYRIIHKTNGIRWVESKIIPQLNTGGELIKLYGVTRDITERKKNEERIFEAAQTQAAILNALPPNIALLDEQGKIIAVNESWKKFALQNNLGMPNYGIGYSYIAISEKATGVDKIDGDIIAQGISDVISGQRHGFTMEYSCHSPTEKRWFQVVIAPLAEKKDKGAVVLHINITDRKLAEESLLQSEANLRSVFENTDLSIVLFDTELKIVSFNNNAKVLSIRNFTKKLKPGSSAFNYFPKERRHAIKQAVKRVTESHEMVEYEVSYDMQDGSTEWYEVKWVSVINNKMENIGIILTLKDITHRKRKQAERRKITADLLKRNNDLEQFAYIVSHNLRAPVANIQGLSNLLNSFTPPNGDCVEALQALSSSINNLDTVIIDINNILQVNREINERLEMVSLSSIVAEISESLSLLIDKNSVTITGGFKEIEELLTLRSYIYSIFQNLITNSIKYRQANVNPVITITSKKSWNMITIIFKDNGRGIDMAKNGPHLFGLYKRFDTSVEGKGMGLFMVKIEVESLGGTISVESELNAGTLFTINLPIKSLV